jgi:hypothetical protein
MTVLFPRLDGLTVDQCLENLDQFIEAASRTITVERMPPGTSFAASGGSQIEPASLAELRSLIVDAARQCGFPDRGSVDDRARFDFLASVALAEFEQLKGGEADRDDVWAFIATILLPDVVAWRFIARSPERFHGGVRNTFQRLWMRMWALDGGEDAGTARWALMEQLTEDALVQLTERPSLGANRALSRAIASAWIVTAERVGRSRMQDVMRSAIIDVRIRNEIQLLDVLAHEELEAQVRRFFVARAAVA